MPRKQVLIAGASGLVGYAAMRVFGADPECDVIALSRRGPVVSQGARFLPVDLPDADACERLAASVSGVTHLVYAALYERPGLVAGWQEREQIETNARMFRNLLDPLERHATNLKHVTLLQGTKAYGVHVRPLAVPAREGRSELRQQANFYWQQEDYLRGARRGQDWRFTILRPVLIIGEAIG